MSKKAKKPPLKKFKVGRVNTTVWLNEGEKGAYHSINFDRRYKTDDGEWRTVSSFSAEDLPDLIASAEMAKGTLPVLERIERNNAA